MSDTEGIQFEPGGDDDYEVVALKDGETLEETKEEPKEPEKVQLTKEEFQALIAGKDSTQALTQGLEKLGEKLGGPSPIPAYVPQAGEPQEEDLEGEAFKPGQFTKVVSKIVEKTQAQTLSQIARISQEQEKKLLKLDPETSEIYKKYEKEIEAKVASLPPNLRFAPDIYGQAYRVVVQEKMAEIIEMKAGEKAAKIAEEAVAKALAEAGIKPKTSSAPQAVYSEGFSSAPPKPKAKLVITAKDQADMIASAMDPRDPEQVRSYLRIKQERGIK